MPKKSPARKPRTINQQLTSLQRLVQTGFGRTDGRFRGIDGRLRGFDARFRGIDGRIQRLDAGFSLEFRNLRKEMNQRFEVLEDRIDRLATHVDGFMKLHETLDIEVRVMKEQMKRLEERIDHLEAAGRS